MESGVWLRSPSPAGELRRAGGVLVHQNGVTLSQPLGDTVALVQAPGASGVDVLNQTGVSTDWRGYAVVPYLTPYRRNIVGLDGESLPKMST